MGDHNPEFKPAQHHQSAESQFKDQQGEHHPRSSPMGISSQQLHGRRAEQDQGDAGKVPVQEVKHYPTRITVQRCCVLPE